MGELVYTSFLARIGTPSRMGWQRAPNREEAASRLRPDGADSVVK
jgi:hypothetical protein